MFKLKNLLKNKMFSMFVKVVLALLICYLFLSIFRKCTEGYEGRKELMLLRMEGCPYCVKIMPDWEAAKTENNTDVVMSDYERSEKKGEEMCKKYNVTGFPTILLLNGENNATVYDGERTKEGFLKALKSI